MSTNSNPLKRENILVVDDVPENLQLLITMLKTRGYKVRPAPSGKLALQAAKAEPPDLVLLDINMPDMNGYEVCKKLKEDDRLKDIPVIFISALTDTHDKIEGFEVGGVDYITKPFRFQEVNARVETHLKLHHMQVEMEIYNSQLKELVAEKVKEISDSQMATIFALAKLAEYRDQDTGSHLERVQFYCKLLASRLCEMERLSKVCTGGFVETIFHASPLHDIGKVGIPDRVLLKPDKLTDEEFELIKTHTVIGASTLEAVSVNYPNNPFIDMGIAIARWHHEKWDGSGYPDGLEGEDIPLPARIMALVDVYDALRSKRPYKEPFTHEESYEIISRGRGTHFCPLATDAFLELSESFRNFSETTQML